MFKKILVANRGEIACRIMRTAERLGIDTVAVYSDADADSLHVRMASEKIHIGSSSVSQSYLQGEKILNAAKITGAEAIHPGYGFLSENADFAEAVEETGLKFIGPSAKIVRSMGAKDNAKKIMEKANVPVLPGYYGTDQSLQCLVKSSNDIGYPVLLKAVLGGGGKGMRVVKNEDDLPDAVEAVKREGESFFGDGQFLVEKYLTKPRHVEVQIFGDSHGNIVHLFERDCSLQRRHQKVIEEAPAPNLSENLRQKIVEVAVAAGKAIKYENAGTIEFLLDVDDKFYFMEMNTRLQVEHPVTEMITGQDLVEWQLLVATGKPLPMAQDKLFINGHAIEARLYAEDPSADFRPAPGKVQHLSFPVISEHVRIDTGIDTGTMVSSFYDPMMAKLIVWDENRETACQRMSAALRALHVVGPIVNRQFLLFLINKHDFRTGDVHTEIIDNLDAAKFTEQNLPEHEDLICASLWVIKARERLAFETAAHLGDPCSPWALSNCWRLNDVSYQEFRFRWREGEANISARPIGDDYDFWHRDDETSIFRVSITEGKNGDIEAVINQRKVCARVIEFDNELTVFSEERMSQFTLVDYVVPEIFENTPDPILTAPMSGKLVSINVREGEKVIAGTTLLIIEAMKMEHAIKAPKNGKVTSIYYQIDDQVLEGSEILVFESLEDSE